MDILYADDMKKDVRIVLWYLKRKLKKEYGVTMEQIKNDIENSGNPVISLLWKNVKESADKIKETYQKELVTEFPMVALWIVYKDTAYNAPFMYIIKNVLDEKEKLLPFVEKYYKEPEDWYVNRWHDTKEHTKKLKEEGKLPELEGALSIDEEIFVPKYQMHKIDVIDNEIKKRRKAMNLSDGDLKNLD
jgi:hypothetical protein